MSHHTTISDALYLALATRAAEAGTTPEALAETTIQEMLADEQAWDVLTQQPGAHAFHTQLQAQAAASREAGEVEEMGDDL